MPEGNKEEVLTVEDAFDAPQPDEIKTAEVEPVTQEAVSDKTETTTEAEPTTQKKWSELGIPDFDGLNQDEIAKIIKQEREEFSFRNRLYGEQANELGELRKKATEKPDTLPEKKEVQDGLRPMTESEIADYNAVYEKNPAAALIKYGNAELRKLIQDELKTKVKDEVGKSEQGITFAIELRECYSKHSDMKDTEPFMRVLDDPKYLGNQSRKLEDLYQLSRLALVKDELYNPVYELMSRFPAMDFAEAKDIVVMRKQTKVSDANNQAVNKAAETINLIDNKPRVKVSAGAKKAKSIDEAFEAEE